MANSEEIIKYKKQIINTIINDYELIRLLDETYVDENTQTTVDADILIYTKIFPYYFNPEFIEEEISFIIMTVDTPKVQGDLIKDMQITITPITNQGLMKVPYTSEGTRIDLMGACIDRLFNGRNDIGFGSVSLVSNYESSIDTKHRCRILKFKVEDFNQSRCS